MPIDTRLTPAARKSAKRPASMLVGFASSVISRSSAGSNHRAASSSRAPDGRWVHQTGCAAAEEHRRQAPTAESAGLGRQFAPQRLGEAGLIDPLPHVGVEVAIRAFGQAERPVDIQRQIVGQSFRPAWNAHVQASWAPPRPPAPGARHRIRPGDSWAAPWDDRRCKCSPSCPSRRAARPHPPRRAGRRSRSRDR